jgi:hypothetical protein
MAFVEGPPTAEPVVENAERGRGTLNALIPPIGAESTAAFHRTAQSVSALGLSELCRNSRRRVVRRAASGPELFRFWPVGHR